MQFQTFYIGLNEPTRQIIDVVARAHWKKNDPKSCLRIDWRNGYEWVLVDLSQSNQNKLAGIYEVDTMTTFVS